MSLILYWVGGEGKGGVEIIVGLFVEWDDMWVMNYNLFEGVGKIVSELFRLQTALSLSYQTEVYWKKEEPKKKWWNKHSKKNYPKSTLWWRRLGL